MPKRRLVEVTWIDPTICAGWNDHQDIDEPLEPIITYGILIRRGKQVTVAGSISPKDGKYADVTRFPKGCVISLRVIETVNI